MQNRIGRILSIFLYVLLALGLVYLIFFYTGGKVVSPSTGELTDEPKALDTSMLLAYILVGIAAIAALVFPIMFTILHPRQALGALVGILVFALILGIGYLMAQNNPVGSDNPATPQTLKLVGAGLKSAYIFLGLAFIGIVISEVSAIFR